MTEANNTPSSGEVKGIPLSEWLSERDAALAGLAAELEKRRPDHLAPADQQINFLSEIAEVTGRREEIHAILSEIRTQDT